jgi:hypothetical protein
VGNRLQFARVDARRTRIEVDAGDRKRFQTPPNVGAAEQPCV